MSFPGFINNFDLEIQTGIDTKLACPNKNPGMIHRLLALPTLVLD